MPMGYGSTVRRIAKVFVVLSTHFFPFIFCRETEQRAQIFRATLEEMGGAWIKLGQALALRFDLLPDAYCRELFKLLNQVDPFPYATVREIVHQELGKYPEELFHSFDPQPFSAASIGQVHRAQLADGEQVAVKIQRPEIREVIRSDIRAMYLLASICDRLHILGATRSRLIIDQFAAWTEQELDYRVEAQHANILRQNQGDEGLEKNAAVYPDYSTSRVLTTQFLEGILLLDILRALRDGDHDYLDELAARGYRRQRIARHLVWNLLNQVYLFGYFHADLHPANLIVLPSNRIGYVDFGIVGRLAPQVRQSHVYYAWNLFRGNVEAAADEFMRWVTPSAATDVASARADLIRIIENYLTALSVARQTGSAEVSSAELQSMAVIRRHRMIVDPGTMLCIKALLTTSAVVFELVPDFDLRGEEQRFFRSMLAEWGTDFNDPQQIIETTFEYSHRFQRALEKIESRTATGSQSASPVSRRTLRALALFNLIALGCIWWLLSGAQFPTMSRFDWKLILQGVAVVIALPLVIILWEIRRLPRDD